MEYLSPVLIIISIVIEFILIFRINSISKSDSSNSESDNAALIESIKSSINEMEQNLSRIEVEQQNISRSHAKELNEYMIRILDENNKGLIRSLNTFNEHSNQNISNSFNSITNSVSQSYKNQNELIDNRFNSLAQSLFTTLKNDRESNKEKLDGTSKTIATGIDVLNKTTETRLDLLTNTLNENFSKMRLEINQQLDRMRETVNEKLDKTLNEQFEKSFRGVLTQMNDLQKSMGELKIISTQVGSLEKTLNGVKTRGIVGEVQLKSIIADVLTPNQYDIEVPTKPGSSDHVEIAIKLPEKDGDGFIYLPIDSKCHLDRYEELLDAYDSGNSDYIKASKKKFADAIRSDAQNICNKYISVPDTTPYAVLFVPFEGMYSEIVNLNLLDELNKHHITVAGPYTLMAILSTVTNYFQALAIEKKSHDIERTLGKVKSEFGKYNDVLSKVRKNLDVATKNLEHLQETRTKAIGRALNGITEITEGESLLQDDEPLFLLPEDYE